MPHNKQNLDIKEILNGITFLILAWSVCIIGSLSWNIYQTYQQSYKRAESTALSNFNRDQAFRNWINNHKGIYVQTQGDTGSDSDIMESYIQLDPATFLTQVMDDYPDYFDSSIRMISISPLNVRNIPNSWENNILESFRKGGTEFLDYDLSFETHHLGFFKPMFVKPSCLSCHTTQGFKTGDLMGAAGVYIDINPFLNSAKELSRILIISHLIIWVFGYIIIVIYGRKTALRIEEQLRLEKELEYAHDQLELKVIQRTAELSKLSEAVKHSPSMVLITDKKGFIEYVNPRFSEISGYSAHDVIGRTPAILKSPNTSEDVYKDLWDTINRGLVWSGELCNLRKDGSEFWVSASIGSSLSEAHEIISYIGVEEDITEKKQIEKNLLLAKDSAEKANQAKSEFLASMSHELRTPLNAIIGFSQLAEIDKNLNKQQKKNSQEIYKAGKHLLSLVDEILDLTSIEIGKVKLNLQPIELKILINECYELISPMAAKNKVKLNFSNYECGCMVQADYLRLKQIILNVLSNAVKYTGSSGSIQLSCNDSKNDDIIIKITDSGAGISEENINQLFEPFNRLGKENSGIKGTGIGLVISKKLVDMMGGSIQVESELEQGSVFSILLPRLIEKNMIEINRLNEIDNQINQENSKLTIFYIEDNPANLKLMEGIILFQKGWTLSHAMAAEQGIELIKKNPPDLILMDIGLPGMNGIEACHVIKGVDRLKHIPIIAISAGAMKDNIETAMKADFHDYITKPVDVKNLIQIINQIQES
ncbi:MAG: response regulator [gamma proteobacterium symbiont of Taylorina sp.]|nr:response regulator [gamma proteobacterium symbiont of Taylorina sp.]